MNGASVQDWVFWVSGAVLALCGVVLALWALFWDRARGRRRCPRCWYSMEGVPHAGVAEKPIWVCPECGKEISGIRRLARTHRRRGWVGVAAMLLIAAYVTVKAPEWSRGDWTALVPTTVLVFIAGAEDPGLEELKRQAQTPSGVAAATPQFQNVPPGLLRRVAGMGLPPAPVVLSTAELLEGAAWSRLNTGRMWRWQSQVFVGRYMRKAQLSLLDEVMVPTRWLAGDPVPVGLNSRRARPPARDRLRAGIAIAGAEGGLVRRHSSMVPALGRRAVTVKVPLELRANGRTIYSQTFKVPIVLCDRVEDLLQPVDSVEATLRIRGVMDLGVQTGGGTEVVADDRVMPDRWAGTELGVAYRIEILLDGVKVCSAAGGVPWDYASLKAWTDRLPGEWAPGAQDRVIQAPERARLVVTGDLQGAWDMYRAWPFEKNGADAWTGRYAIPVRVDYPRSQNQR